MLKKLRTVIYHVNDLDRAKTWYNEIFGIAPYFDEPFYVGYDINGCELGLDPSSQEYSNGNHAITYWLVDDIQASFTSFASKGVPVHQQITEVGGGILTGSIADPFGNVIGLIQVPEEPH